MGIVATRKYSIGLKLSSFIGTDEEYNVMTSFEHILNELPEAVSIKLWYCDGDIKKGQLREFMKEWGDLLSNYGTQLYCFSDTNHKMYKCWFNILSKEDYDNAKFDKGRFQFIYDRQGDGEPHMYYGIFSFLKVLKFHCRDDRLDNHQKRSNYEGRYRRKS